MFLFCVKKTKKNPIKYITDINESSELRKAGKSKGMGEGYEKLELDKMESQREAKRRIIVRQGTKTRIVNIEDVIYIESLGRKAVLHLKGETIEYYEKISSLEEQLYPVFFRVHRAYLVNLDYVESYTKREVLLKNAESVLISKYRIREFQKVLAK